MALVGLFFQFLGIETHGRAMTVEAELGLIAVAALSRAKSTFSLEDVKARRTRSLRLGRVRILTNRGRNDRFGTRRSYISSD
jgi:hypothetical protein